VFPTPFGPYRGRPTCVARAANRSPAPIPPSADSAGTPYAPPKRARAHPVVAHDRTHSGVLRLRRIRRGCQAGLGRPRCRGRPGCATWPAATEPRVGSLVCHNGDTAIRRPRTRATTAPPRSGTWQPDRVSPCSTALAAAMGTQAELEHPPAARRSGQRAHHGFARGAHAAAGPGLQAARRT
jgi:hypothetical protein